MGRILCVTCMSQDEDGLHNLIGPKKLVVSHGVDLETDKHVILPNEHPSILGALWDENLREYVIEDINNIKKIKKCEIYVVNHRDLHRVPKNAEIVDTTSRNSGPLKRLSPFYVPCGPLYQNFSSINVENAWQFCKVYREHLDQNGKPSKQYFEWAKKGWADKFAHRYPMGKNRRPEYSFWDGHKMDYVEARQKIYVPLYSRVVNTSAFQVLEKMVRTSEKDIYLLDFDGYNHRSENKSLTQVLQDPQRKMGHAFVLYGLLTGEIEKIQATSIIPSKIAKAKDFGL
jgi:hypothetical protein